MLKKNEEYIVDIIDNGYQGEGIAKIDGITVFVDKAIKGEKIRIKIVKVMSDFCFAKVIELLEKAEYRVDEECSTYRRCGGCNLRHIEYKETLNIKRQIVQNCLYKSLKKEVNVENTIGMENPFYYRNKLQYPVGINDNSVPIIGVYSSRTHDIIETKECFIQNKVCQEIANDILEFIKTNKISVYDEKTLKGTMRHIIVRIGVKTNEVLITIVVNDDNDIKEKGLIQLLTNKYKRREISEESSKLVTEDGQGESSRNKEIKAIVKNINNKNTNVILGKTDKIIYGNGYIHDMIRRI